MGSNPPNTERGDESHPIKPGKLHLPEPDEPFKSQGAPCQFSTQDFWRWMMSDLRMNTTRAFLGEFLVTRALQNEEPYRKEWAAFDVLAPTSTRVEVKTAGLAQSWPSKASTVSFTFRTVDKTRMWNDDLGYETEVDPDDRVHVWVFALNTIRQDEPYDPLNLDRWEFRAVPHIWLRRCGQRSASLTFLDRNGFDPVGFDELLEAVEKARRRHGELL